MTETRRKILVPLDLEEDPREALAAAVAVAHENGGAIRLLHVVPNDEIHLLREVYHPEQSGGANPEKAAEVARQWLQGIAETHVPPGVDVAIEVDFGEPAGRILDHTRNGNSDLVVIARNRGTRRVREWILGSTSYDVFRNAGCDVMLVREAPRPQEVDVASRPTDEPAAAQPHK